MTTERAGEVIYVVHRIGLDERGGLPYPIARASSHHPKRIQGRSVGAFTDRAQAEAFQHEQECRITKGKNPFEYLDVSLEELTSVDENVFADLVQDLGLEPPEVEDGERNWALWWACLNTPLTPEQLAGIWPHIDRLHFFQIVEVSLS